MVGRKQFDVDAALEQAMLTFWRQGYAETSLGDLTTATGLNRSSLYATFGDKSQLFLSCLERYAQRYGERYDRALATAADSPLDAVARFYDVTLDRIADPALPTGCLVAQSTMAAPALPPGMARRTTQALGAQRDRLRAALAHTRLDPQEADRLALHLAAVNQSLAVLSRAEVPARQLRSVADVAVATLAHALDAAGQR
ncbi:TetR/AcrR family transcriptional regulator [Promicromonospora sp. NPDC050880]|uniref:TetR/AcrR family transcriptional regulator n=1 Tax=Promicromonospora sp. NPDC050880 TaxID=3364406 RepID=UPI003793343F